MKRAPVIVSLVTSGLLTAAFAGQHAKAAPSLPESGPIVLTLEEAVDLALAYSYALRQQRIERDDVFQQVRSSWSPVWPRIDGSATYDRNLAAPNPFAGSGAGGAFDAFDAIGWLSFNEQARLSGRPTISLEEFRDRNTQALANVGVTVDPDANPFLVENQFNFSLVIKQVIYDHAVFAGLSGSDVAEDIANFGVDAEALNVVRDVASAFYGALLAAQQTEILEKSVARTQSTVDETKKRVEQGVVPRFQLLTAEVELANLQTELSRARNAAQNSVDDLRLVVGLPANRPVELRGALSLTDVGVDAPTPEEAVEVAFENRPDFKQAVLSVEAADIQASATWGEFFPKINAVANLAYIGTVPDDRTITVPTNNPDDPFEVRSETNSFFSDSYWFSSVAVGLQLEWTIFEGFATSAQYQRDLLAARRARVQLEQARSMVQIEVEQSLRGLTTARQQIETQERNRERAELNYEHAQVRVREGVSSQFELRQASEQLDESRFNYLQAVHDFLVARIAYLVAIGTPPITGSGSK